MLQFTSQKPSDPISFPRVSQVSKTQNVSPGPQFIFNSSCHWVICLYWYDFTQHQSLNDLALASKMQMHYVYENCSNGETVRQRKYLLVLHIETVKLDSSVTYLFVCTLATELHCDRLALLWYVVKPSWKVQLFNTHGNTRNGRAMTVSFSLRANIIQTDISRINPVFTSRG